MRSIEINIETWKRGAKLLKSTLASDNSVRVSNNDTIRWELDPFKLWINEELVCSSANNMFDKIIDMYVWSLKKRDYKIIDDNSFTFLDEPILTNLDYEKSFESKRNLLVSRNLDGRTEKLRQQNLRMLQQEIIDGNLIIDDLWDFKSDQIKTKNINGNIIIKIIKINNIPAWLENVKVNGYFNCLGNSLTSLKGCPKIISGEFDCSYNKLTSLKGCPETLGNSFYCLSNQLTSLQGCPKIINGNFRCSNNLLTSLNGCPEKIHGNFNCSTNVIKFTMNDIPKKTIIKGKITF